MIKAIIFDFAGVITTEGYWDWLAVNMPNFENEREYLLNFSKGVDKNETTEDEFLTMLSVKTGKEKNIIKQEVYAKYSLQKDVVKLINFLKKDYKIGLLSNFVIGWLRDILKKLNIENLFDIIVISAEVRMVKPKPEIYKKTLELLNVTSNEAVFIDDRIENVIGAKNVGIKSFLYKDFDDLILNLQRLGINTSAQR